MKKLISAEDIELAESRNEKTIYISKNAIITPLAEELGKNSGIEFTIREESPSKKEGLNSFKDQLNMDNIYKICKLMDDKGILKEVMELLSPKPYIEEGEEGSLRIIRGSSIKYKAYDTGNEKDKVFYQEISSKEDASIRAGFLKIEDSNFQRKSKSLEVAYLIEGILNIEVNDKSFEIYPGDMFYIPSNSNLIYKSEEKTKLFYLKDLNNR